MATGGSQSDASGDGEYYRQPESKPPSVLDEAIRKTIADTRPQESISEEEFASLTEVARRHQDRELELEPVVVELVDALLAIRLPAGAVDATGATVGPGEPAAKARREMSREIATSIFDDPHGRQRLTSLWATLVEAIQ